MTHVNRDISTTGFQEESKGRLGPHFNVTKMHGAVIKNAKVAADVVSLNLLPYT